MRPVVVAILTVVAVCLVRPAPLAQSPEGPVATISGTLVKTDGSAVADVNVYLALVKDNRARVDFEDGKVRNPSARSDAKGRFTIKTGAASLGNGQEFTIGLLSGVSVTPLRRSGLPLTLKFTAADKTKTIDLGKITLE